MSCVVLWIYVDLYSLKGQAKLVNLPNVILNEINLHHLKSWLFC